MPMFDVPKYYHDIMATVTVEIRKSDVPFGPGRRSCVLMEGACISVERCLASTLS